MSKILITGASGLIGRAISKFLIENNYELVKLSRFNKNNPNNVFFWDIEKQIIEDGALDNLDHIIHLAGAGIGDKRWTQKRKNEIIESRVKSAELLYTNISKLTRKPKTFISASAIGYYGAKTTDKILNEDDSPADDFQGEVCKLWESSSKQFERLGLRTVQLRFGVVLSQKGGALEKMLIPVKLGIGSPLGSGSQFIPWIHIKDVINIILYCIENEKINGAYNIVSPSFITNKQFLLIIAEVLNRPFIMPKVPSTLLKLLLGQMSELVLEGSRISPQKIIDAGYKFSFADTKKAIENLLNSDQ
ncbi:MAG: TIGR01777 family protein [Ignavibacteriae bacterium]|jgi:uncharacterized protein|nr:TIGR01777 family protein [Ignavibacteriota bacterium]